MEGEKERERKKEFYLVVQNAAHVFPTPFLSNCGKKVFLPDQAR